MPGIKRREQTPESELRMKIRIARTQAGMNQEQVAAALRISAKTYSAYELGRNRLTMKTFLALPAIFGCSIADLLPSSVVTAVDQRRSKDFRLEEIIDIWAQLSDERFKNYILETARMARETDEAGKRRAAASRKLSVAPAPPVEKT